MYVINCSEKQTQQNHTAVPPGHARHWFMLYSLQAMLMYTESKLRYSDTSCTFLFYDSIPCIIHRQSVNRINCDDL